MPRGSKHARAIIDPERQAALDRRFVRAREAAVYRDVDRDMAGIPIEPAGPPGAKVFENRAAELTPEDASDDVRARIGQVAAFAQRRAERQWNKQQAEAGIAALDWVGKNSGGSFLAIPLEIREWLAPDQWRGLGEDYQHKMMGGIVAFELRVLAMQCKVKLNQHRPEAQAAMRALYSQGNDSERALAQWMDKLAQSKN